MFHKCRLYAKDDCLNEVESNASLISREFKMPKNSTEMFVAEYNRTLDISVQEFPLKAR